MKFKYSVGEKVLCYEPDETKARVLYNAKIMDADIIKDLKGKKYVEYKIHFQGWNHAWDRWADESFVLKDNEQNRKMQRKLAKKAIRKLKLQKGKKRHHLPGVASKPEGDEIKNIDSSSEDSFESDFIGSADVKEKLYDFGDECPPLKKARIVRRPSHETLAEEDGCSSKDDYHLRRLVSLDIPHSLQLRLEEDNTTIKKRDMLVSLPTCPNVVQILENYAKKFAVQSLGAVDKQKFTNSNQTANFDNVLPPDKRLNLCQEICSDLKLLFDYALPLCLLYLPEREQYKDLMKKTRIYGAKSQRLKENVDSFKESSSLPSEQLDSEGQSLHQGQTKDKATKEEVSPSNVKDPAQESDAVLKTSADIPVASMSSLDQESTSDHACHTASHDPPKSMIKKKNAEAQLIEETHKYLIPNQPNLDQTGLSKDSQGRRRSSRLSQMDSSSPQKSTNSDENYQIAAGTNLCEFNEETNASGKKNKYDIVVEPFVFLRSALRQNRYGPPNSTSVASCSTTAIARQPLFNATPCMDKEQYLAVGGGKNMKELKKAWDWCIVPNTYRPEKGANVPPSLIYGIHHLLRLFVKLPDILMKMAIPEFKLKILIKHMNKLLKFLSEYERELFEIDVYIPVCPD